MEFIHPDQILAEEMISAMNSHVEKGTMLAQNVEDILQSFESWFVGINQQGQLAGFFCFRRPPCQQYAELGSVLSLENGVGKALIQKFEAERSKEGQPYGCAITKNRAEFFALQTQGKISIIFPEWYKKSKDDKYFVSWPK